MALFVQNNYDALKLIYRLYKPIDNGLKPIADKFKQQLSENGKSLIESVETTQNGKELPVKAIMLNSQLVERVLDLLTHNWRVIVDCFASDTLFDRQLQLSFQDFLNIDVGKFSMAELLPYHADKVLRKGGIKGDKKMLEEQMDNLAQLFTYLYDKDLFLSIYSNQLARRLLAEAYEDFELEKQFITRLKVTCGMQQMTQL